jgi:hypothetical protein
MDAMAARQDRRTSFRIPLALKKSLADCETPDAAHLRDSFVGVK